MICIFQLNKNYMYELISNIVQKETGKNIINDNNYIHHFKLQYPIIFQKMNTDNLSDLNKELLNIVGSFIIQDIQKDYQINNITILEKNNLPIIQESEIEDDSDKSFLKLTITSGSSLVSIHFQSMNSACLVFKFISLSCPKNLVIYHFCF